MRDGSKVTPSVFTLARIYMPLVIPKVVEGKLPVIYQCVGVGTMPCVSLLSKHPTPTVWAFRGFEAAYSFLLSLFPDLMFCASVEQCLWGSRYISDTQSSLIPAPSSLGDRKFFSKAKLQCRFQFMYLVIINP